MHDVAKLQNIASNPSNSVWVSANAGSGKTKVLVDRIIRLLLAGVSPDHILCLTYTKAAAAEMLIRLQKTINSWAIIPQEKLQTELAVIFEHEVSEANIEAARNLFFNFHDAPKQLPILTIHSFCQNILRQFPHEAQLNPAFQLANDEQARELINAARIAVLQQASRQTGSELGQMLDYLIDNLGEHSFNEWFTKIDVHRHKIRYILQDEASNAIAISMLYAKGGLQQNGDWRDLLHSELAPSDDFHQVLENILPLFAGGAKTDVAKGEVIAKYMHGDKAANTLHDFAFGVLTKVGTQYAKVATDATLKKMPLKLFAEWSEISKRAERYFQKYYVLHSVKLSHGLMLVARSWAEHYQAIKAQHSFVDYADLLEKLHDLLQNHEVADWILYKLDGKIAHLLIDEAQDTSGLQWQITQNLTAELFAGQGANGMRSLFVVGDEKQSIFGFQGAEVQQFVAQSQNYEAKASAIGEKLHRVPLSTSFRSVAVILEFVDSTFAENKWQHHSFRGQQNGRICIYPSPQKNKAMQ